MCQSFAASKHVGKSEKQGNSISIVFKMIKNCSQKKRIEWIDIARAVGIISVIICHAKLPGVQKYICGPIEVTVFFFISGFLLYRKEQSSFLTFLKKKIKGILVPYLFFSVIWIIYDLCLLLTTKQLSPANALQVFLQYLLQIRMKPIWFLTCLFLSEIVMFFIIKFLKNTYVAVAVAFVFVVVGFVYYRYVNYALPWNADLCVVAVPFMIIGYLCNKTSALNFISKKKAWLLILGIIPVYFVLNYLNVFALNNGIDIFYKEFGNYFLFYLVALLGILIVIFFSERVKNRGLTYIGQNSLLIFALHNVVITPLLTHVSYDLTKNDIISILIRIGIALCSLFVCILVNFLIMRTKLKRLLGK